VTGLGKRWDTCKVQTFFASDKCKYFVVANLTQDGRTWELIDCFIDAILKDVKGKDAEEDKRLGIVDSDQHMVDKSPWMRRTGWLQEVAGKDMSTIVKKSWTPLKEEEGLQLIWRSVGRVLDTCVDGVTNCVERNWRLISF